MDPDMQDTVNMLLDVQGTLSIVQLLEKNELTLKELYQAYAARFPVHADFWNRIASDEENHASWISELADAVRNNKMTFSRDRFNPQQLTDFNSYLAGLISQSQSAVFTPLQAAIISLQVEDSLIERHFFRVYDSDSELLNLTLNRIEASTEEHYRRVREFVDSLQPQK